MVIEDKAGSKRARIIELIKQGKEFTIKGSGEDADIVAGIPVTIDLLKKLLDNCDTAAEHASTLPIFHHSAVPIDNCDKMLEDMMKEESNILKENKEKVLLKAQQLPNGLNTASDSNQPSNDDDDDDDSSSSSSSSSSSDSEDDKDDEDGSTPIINTKGI